MAQTYQYQLLPDLGQNEYSVLKADIAEHGILVPVEVDEHGTLLDGHHRVRAWTELTAEGVEVADYPRMIRAGLTEHQKRAHVRRINLVRRHLTQEQRRELIADQLRDTPEQSNVRIGAALGVASNTVAAVRGELETGFQIETLDRTVGSDGKSYPVRTSTTMARDKKEEKQALKNLGLLDAGEEEGEFVCEQCGELFAVDVWHCGNCHHHWPMAHEECQNCHQASRPEYAPPRNVTAPVHVSHNSGQNEWYTPGQFVDAARDVMGGIDLDPASSDKANETVRALRYFTKDDNGLLREWRGRVWMNPPYAQPLIQQFCEKVVTSYRDGSVSQAVVLVNNATETRSFQGLAREASAICFPRGRIRYHDSTGNPVNTPLQGQAFVYFGDQAQRFLAVFRAFGVAGEWSSS